MRDFSKITRVRSIWEKQARANLGEANQELLRAQDDVVAALDDHRAAVAGVGMTPGPDDLMMRRIAGLATHERYSSSELVRGQAEHRSRAAHGSWRQSAQDLEISEKLDQRRKQALAYLARRSAEAALDELMVLRRSQR